MDFNDAALSQVLKSIETQSRYTFFYNNDIDVAQTVSAHIVSNDIDKVVTTVLNGTDIAHQITGNRVVLFVGGVIPLTISPVRSPEKSPTQQDSRWSA
ncbi:MAG: secretin and TonB N-terminal domain-containing protein [Alistipes sp.]|nr:secretin and TonB N-terminal domain-containing protein [Alistipes sp.]